MDKTLYPDGLIIKSPSEAQEAFVVCKLSIKKAAFVQWLNQQEGDWVNLTVTKAKEDPKKFYSKLDTWKPDPTKAKPRSQADIDFDNMNGGIQYPSDKTNPEDIPF